jgi:hypothetical protein
MTKSALVVLTLPLAAFLATAANAQLTADACRAHSATRRISGYRCERAAYS